MSSTGRRRASRAAPVVVLLALTAGGVIAGLVGAFIAVPLAAVAGAVIDFARS